MSYNAQPLGILDGWRRMPPPGRSQGVYTHNPYWYEGFDPSALAGTSSPQRFHSNGYKLEEQTPYPWTQQHWPGRVSRPPLRSLRSQMEPVLRKPQSPQTLDYSSDHTMGYSDSGSDRGSEDKDAQLEAQLVQCILNYFGDCQGSLPSERVQNVIKKDYPELYEQVVVARFRKKWHKFLQHCSDTFHLFTRPAQPLPNQDYCWRIRLVGNTNWEEADQLDEECRAQRDKELLDKVHSILSGSPDGQCLMIDVINELNKDIKVDDDNERDDSEESDYSGRKARKIRAGDLKRLMRKCNSNFSVVEYQDAESQKRSTYMKLVEPAH